RLHDGRIDEQGLFEEAAGLLVRAKQVLDPGPELVVPTANAVQVGAALSRRVLVHRRQEDLFHIHGTSLLSITVAPTRTVRRDRPARSTVQSGFSETRSQKARDQSLAWHFRRPPVFCSIAANSFQHCATCAGLPKAPLWRVASLTLHEPVRR